MPIYNMKYIVWQKDLLENCKDVMNMYIADAAECNQKQSIINVNKRPATVRSRDNVNATAGETESFARSLQTGDKSSVVVELSQEGKALAEQTAVKTEPSSWEKMLEKMKQEQAAMTRSLQKAAGKKKKKSKPTGDLSRALAIARRIMKGDKVPPKDESFLFRYNSDLYLKAKMMAMQNENPKKHKSLLEELEEEQGGDTNSPAGSGDVQTTPSEGTESSGESESSDED